MQLKKLILIVITLLFVFNCNAAEQVLEPHAMLYFQVPLGSNYKDHAKPAFGFRMDNALVEPGKPIDYPKLFSHQAVFDLKMGRSGVESLKFSGVDILKQIRTLQANGDDTDTQEDAAGAAAGDTGAAGEGSTASSQDEAGSGEKKGILSKLPDYSNAIKKTQWLGLAIGIGIGFIIIAGP